MAKEYQGHESKPILIYKRLLLKMPTAAFITFPRILYDPRQHNVELQFCRSERSFINKIRNNSRKSKIILSLSAPSITLSSIYPIIIRWVAEVKSGFPRRILMRFNKCVTLILWAIVFLSLLKLLINKLLIHKSLFNYIF